jgi:LysM repeat protein
MSFDLPEESLNNNFDTTIEETTNLDTYDNLDVETNDDFSFDTDEIDIQETNFDDELNVDLNNLDSDFDQNNLSNENNTSDNIPVGGGISFTGLYDKETELGESSSFEEEEVKKRTKKPVIICIICAIICIIATILILFFVPGILKKDKIESEISETTIESPLPEEVVEEPIVEEVIPEAKEDEIIVVEKAEEVVPEQPPVVEEEEPAPKVITYKIKWGDTLWDIADTYYKNPWKYKFIAKHNNIKNPDHIISGTFIEIPEE